MRNSAALKAPLAEKLRNNLRFFEIFEKRTGRPLAQFPEFSIGWSDATVNLGRILQFRTRFYWHIYGYLGHPFCTPQLAFGPAFFE